MIEIRYVRPASGTTVFRQQLVHRAPDGIVTLLEHASITRPMIVDSTTILEPGAPIVWFTFPGAWHDIGRFHMRDGTFTGYYANVLTPVHFVSNDIWETTDLFLDVWQLPDGAVLLDEDELDAAVRDNMLSTDLARRARIEAQSLLDAATRGEWPPDICRDWTLDRAREHAAAEVSNGTSGTRTV